MKQGDRVRFTYTDKYPHVEPMKECDGKEGWIRFIGSDSITVDFGNEGWCCIFFINSIALILSGDITMRFVMVIALLT